MKKLKIAIFKLILKYYWLCMTSNALYFEINQYVEENSVVKYIMATVYRNFDPEWSVMLSILNEVPENYQNNMDITLSIIRELNWGATWSFQISCPGAMEPDLEFVNNVYHNGYIVFTWPDEDGEITGNLIDQMESLKMSTTWNSRALFLVILLGQRSNTPDTVAQEVAEELGKNYNAINITILVCQESIDMDIKTHSSEKKYASFKLYSWLPYQSSDICSEVKVVLISHWEMSSQETEENVTLLQRKIPNNLLGCQLSVGLIYFEGGFVQFDSVVDEEGNIDYNYWGLEFELYKLVQQALNFTPVYYRYGPGDGLEIRYAAMRDISNGLLDIMFGGFPWNELLVPFVDSVSPYLQEIVTWNVPCSSQLSRMEKVSKIFDVSVWSTMFLTFCLSIFTIWLIARSTSRHAVEEHSCYRQVAYNLYNSFAITLGVSVSKMPVTGRVRMIFIIVVVYCFAISSIFQTFFTSILVDPGMDTQLKTFKEMVESGFLYYYNPTTDNFINITDSEYHDSMILEKVECLPNKFCLEYVQGKNRVRVAFIFLSEIVLLYTIPPGEEIPKLCTLDENIFILHYSLHLAKGSPLLGLIDITVLYLKESGLVDKTINDFKNKVRYMVPNDNETFELSFQENSEYFVFSLAHLYLAFYFLLYGYASGVAILILELLVNILNLKYIFENYM
ncbi:Ionotropic receptor 259 [Blattella germanica]|nr:Ionotropic receptor 259 [Blattella germanica]